MILREALNGARERLRASGSDEPDIEAEVLLRHALGIDRATFLRVLNETISGAEAEAYERALARRLQGEPTAYIIGVREFFGRDFKVTPAVLVPRPETEMLVEAVVAWAADRDQKRQSGAPSAAHPEALGEPAPSQSKSKRRAPGLRIADIGTGSGAIAVSLAKMLPTALIYATDLSAAALAVARANARSHGLEQRISFRRGDLLETLDARVDVIAANLPYVTEQDWRDLPREIRDHEPRLALASGDDGLDAIRALLTQAHHYLEPGGTIFLEFGIGQDETIRAAASRHFHCAQIETRTDFADIPRLLVVTT